MDNNELFTQVIAAMQEQTEVLTKLMDSKIESVRQEIKASESRLDQKIKESETRINVKIENEVSRKIESLFDGYKLTHEKQWEMERRIDDLERRLERIENAG